MARPASLPQRHAAARVDGARRASALLALLLISAAAFTAYRVAGGVRAATLERDVSDELSLRNDRDEGPDAPQLADPRPSRDLVLLPAGEGEDEEEDGFSAGEMLQAASVASGARRRSAPPPPMPPPPSLLPAVSRSTDNNRRRGRGAAAMLGRMPDGGPPPASRASDAAGAARAAAAAARAYPPVLILSPVKNAAAHLPRYFSLLRRLAYPKSRLSLGLLDSDSDDAPSAELLEALRASPHGRVRRLLRAADAATAGANGTAAGGRSGGGGARRAAIARNRTEGLGAGFFEYDEARPRLTGTLAALLSELPALAAEFRRVTVLQHDFGLALPRAGRHAQDVQLARRGVIARSRNHLLFTAMRDEEWVLWIDADLESYPPTALSSLLAPALPIVAANAVMEPGGRSYDMNSWRFAEVAGAAAAPSDATGTGGTGGGGGRLGNDATVATVRAAHDAIHARAVASGVAAHRELHVEGYTKTGHRYLHHLKGAGVPGTTGSVAVPVVLDLPAWNESAPAPPPRAPRPNATVAVARLDAVGGAMLLVSAELHRQGLVFPPFTYRHRIETEGLSLMALDMGVLSWGMPGLEVIHL